jgi:hypothetical protein
MAIIRRKPKPSPAYRPEVGTGWNLTADGSWLPPDSARPDSRPGATE